MGEDHVLLLALHHSVRDSGRYTKLEGGLHAQLGVPFYVGGVGGRIA